MIMAKVVEDVDNDSAYFNGKWMMEYRSWYGFVIFTYRTRFEEVLEVIDNIAFRAGRQRLGLKRHSDACGCEDLKLSHQEIATELNS
jgi:CRP/FNR family transcriptional regulator